jgi:hypothetical protein
LDLEEFSTLGFVPSKNGISQVLAIFGRRCLQKLAFFIAHPFEKAKPTFSTFGKANRNRSDPSPPKTFSQAFGYDK